ncbi:MAG: tetratricopeptide repeat protein [Bacteroidota bacterium]
MRSIKKISSIFIWITISLQAYGQDLSPEKLLSRADYLYKHQQNEAAIKEYQRYLFYTGSEDIDVLQKLASGLFQLEYYDLALQYYEQIYYLSDNPNVKFRSRLKEINYHIDQKKYNEALVVLYTVRSDYYDRYPEIINFLFALCHYGLEEFERSEEYFLNIVGSDSIAAQEIKDIFSDKKKFNKPNPKTISILSLFIPGLGQIISGNIKEGLNSFILVEGIGVLAVYVGFKYSIVDAVFSLLPWYQRYLLGGSNKAEKIAIRKRAENRNESFIEILEVLKPFRNEFEVKD